MKSLKSFFAFLLVFSFIFSFTACSKSKALKFTYEEMSITLTDNFKETSYEGYTTCYDSEKAAVFVLKESFDSLEGVNDYNLEEYRDLVIASNYGTDCTPLEIDGMYCIEHSFFNADFDGEYKYLSVTYKSNDAFWLIQFSCLSEDYHELKPDFIKWAKSVRFK